MNLRFEKQGITSIGMSRWKAKPRIFVSTLA